MAKDARIAICEEAGLWDADYVCLGNFVCFLLASACC